MSRTVVVRAPRAGELGWIVSANGAIYREQFGWDESYERLCAQIVADVDPARDRVWIAEVGGAPAGCVICVHVDETTAKLRLLLVTPSARGLGLGSRLVRTCVDHARASGYAELVLWTNSVLTDARRIYEREGFTLVAEEEHHSFGKRLTGQTFRLPL